MAVIELDGKLESTLYCWYKSKWDGIFVPNGMEGNDNGDLYQYVHNIYNIDVWVFDVMMMVFYSFCLRSFGRCEGWERSESVFNVKITTNTQ